MNGRPVVQQLSVTVSSGSGSVRGITGLLGQGGVNIRGFSVSDTANNTVVRLVVDKPDEALRILERSGYEVRLNEALCVRLSDKPGSLAGVLKAVADAGVMIEYVYSLVGTFVVMNVTDIGRTLQLLHGCPIELVSQMELAQLEM